MSDILIGMYVIILNIIEDTSSLSSVINADLDGNRIQTSDNLWFTLDSTTNIWSLENSDVEYGIAFFNTFEEVNNYLDSIDEAANNIEDL